MIIKTKIESNYSSFQIMASHQPCTGSYYQHFQFTKYF